MRGKVLKVAAKIYLRAGEKGVGGGGGGGERSLPYSCLASIEHDLSVVSCLDTITWAHRFNVK